MTFSSPTTAAEHLNAKTVSKSRSHGKADRKPGPSGAWQPQPRSADPHQGGRRHRRHERDPRRQCTGFRAGLFHWDKTFPRSEKVDHQKVTFKNRYGITLAGDLYLPKDRANRRLAALAVGGPFGAVKEQSSGLYAQAMAERGFVTVAFDGSIPEKAAASRATSLRRTSIPRILAPPSTISACTRPLTASGSASSAFAAGAAWP